MGQANAIGPTSIEGSLFSSLECELIKSTINDEIPKKENIGLAYL